MDGCGAVLTSVLRKPSNRKNYLVKLLMINGMPIIEYNQVASKKPNKSIRFTDLLFADRKHARDKFAFSIFFIDRTITFLTQDEATMNEWLTKIKELHSNLYPEFKRYDTILEASLLDKGLAKTLNIQGAYRLALCKDSLDLIPLITPELLQQQQQQQHLQHAANNNNSNSPASGASSGGGSNKSNATSLHNHFSTNTVINNRDQHHHHPATFNPLISNERRHQRFHRRHPLVSSKTIELALRSIRRCGHTDRNFYIELGRHSQVGEGDLWMTLSKKSAAGYLHELLLATMKLASTADDQFPYKTSRSRSGSSSDNAHRTQQSRSSSLLCLSDGQQQQQQLQQQQLQLIQQQAQLATPTTIAAGATNMFTHTHSMASNTATVFPSDAKNVATSANSDDEDQGYLPMA